MSNHLEQEGVPQTTHILVGKLLDLMGLFLLTMEVIINQLKVNKVLSFVGQHPLFYCQEHHQVLIAFTDSNHQYLLLVDTITHHNHLYRQLLLDCDKGCCIQEKKKIDYKVSLIQTTIWFCFLFFFLGE